MMCLASTVTTAILPTRVEYRSLGKVVGVHQGFEPQGVAHDGTVTSGLGDRGSGPRLLGQETRVRPIGDVSGCGVKTEPKGRTKESVVERLGKSTLRGQWVLKGKGNPCVSERTTLFPLSDRNSISLSFT